MIKSKLLILVIFALFIIATAQSQTTFYDLTTIQKIEISFTQPDWDYQMDTAKNGFDSYIMASLVKINGVQFDSVGVKYKGNSSYNSTYLKNPIHISLDEFKSQSYQSIKDIKLGNGYADPSMIREVLSYNILQNYMDCPRSNFAQLFVNGAYVGLYSNAEPIGKSFCSDHFFSSQNTLIKCNPIINPGPATKSNLKYSTADSSDYFNYYEIKSTNGWNDLVGLCDTVTNFSSNISSVLDMDRAIWMLAFNNVLINLDSYTGVFAQNYYLYKDNTKRFNPVIWDLNMSLGGFPFVGSSNSSMGSLTVANMQQLSPTIHSADVYWPLIKDVMNNVLYKRMYIAHMRTIMNEMFVSNSYQTTASQLQTLIDTAIVADTNKFFTYAQFQSAMTSNTTVGSYVVPGISTLMSARVSYLQSLADFTAVPPTISAITPSNLTPGINSTISIAAQVTNTNANSVYLGYRFVNTDKFTRILMTDDGLNNDGTAGDNIYGATFTMNGPVLQYYIYAENNTAGMFSPERAEHEFYTLQSNVQTAASGQVRINEFLAANQGYNTNENGQHEDWIEFYNNTSSSLNMFGLYLTDNSLNLTKFAFPDNAIIQPQGYLVVWADENATTSSYLHCNFKLLSGGEQLVLSDISGNILDSINFGAQVGDVSVGRCPDGTGTFIPSLPTFNASNCLTGINENGAAENEIKVYPNPACEYFTIQFNSTEKENTICLYNALGQEIKTIISTNKIETVSISELSEGFYVLKINADQFKKLQILK